MWVYHRLPRTRISCPVVLPLTPKESAKQAAAAVPGLTTRSLCVFWGNMTASLYLKVSYVIFLLILVYLFWLFFLVGRGGIGLWAFCPQCSFRLLNLEWAEYQNAFCIPQGEGSIDGGSPTWHLCSCFAVLSTYNCAWKNVKAASAFLHMLLVKGVIRGSVVFVWSQGNWLEVGHAEAVRKRPGSVEGHHRHHWKGQGLQQDSHQNLITSSSFHFCLPGTTNWWHSCPLQGKLCNLWVFFVQTLSFEGNPLSLNPNSLQIICCRYWYV